MCGVVGYIGKKKSKQLILNALAKLQYRGCDSAGFACINKENKLACVKSPGEIEQLQKIANQVEHDGTIGIGHTRWAADSELPFSNAHPHASCSEDIAIVHNGFIDNHQELKVGLIKQKHRFIADVDTEVIPHILEHYINRKMSLEAALQKMANQLSGSFALVGLLEKHPDTLFSVRKTAPLALLVHDDGIRIASDYRAIGKKGNLGFFQPDNSFAIITDNDIALYSFEGKRLPVHLDQILVKKPVLERNMLNRAYNDFERALRSFFEYILPDSELSYDYVELLNLAHSILERSILTLNQEHYLRKIVGAIDALEDGTYGLCIGCGQPIGSHALAKHHTLSLCQNCDAKHAACA